MSLEYLVALFEDVTLLLVLLERLLDLLYVDLSVLFGYLNLGSVGLVPTHLGLAVCPVVQLDALLLGKLLAVVLDEFVALTIFIREPVVGECFRIVRKLLREHAVFGRLETGFASC